MVGGSSLDADRIALSLEGGDPKMEYFAGLDVSMAQTHVCVMDRDGIVIYEVKVPSTPADIAAALARVPSCRRVVFDRPDGTDALPWPERAGIADCLH